MKKHFLFLTFLVLFIAVQASVLKPTDGEALFQKASKHINYYNCFDEYTNVINIGIGFGGGDKYFIGSRDSAYNYTVSPTYSLTYEHGIPKLGPGYLGIGLNFGYLNTHYKYINTSINNGYYYNQNWSHLIAAVRIAYHSEYLNNSKTDVYIGGEAGVRIEKYSYSTNDLSINKDDYKLNKKATYPICSVYAGVRRYISRNLGGFIEAGYGISYISFGIVLKF